MLTPAAASVAALTFAAQTSVPATFAVTTSNLAVSPCDAAKKSTAMRVACADRTANVYVAVDGS